MFPIAFAVARGFRVVSPTLQLPVTLLLRIRPVASNLSAADAAFWAAPADVPCVADFAAGQLIRFAAFLFANPGRRAGSTAPGVLARPAATLGVVFVGAALIWFPIDTVGRRCSLGSLN